MRCHICKRILNVPGEPESKDCGGDCLLCMADVGDPDAIEELDTLRRTTMLRIRKFIVNADHPNERFNCVEREITVREDSHPEGGWYVDGGVPGCGRTAATPETAIRSILYENGCENIKILREVTE